MYKYGDGDARGVILVNENSVGRGSDMSKGGVYIEIYNWQESCEIRQTTEAAWGMIENSKLPFPCMMWHHPPK